MKQINITRNHQGIVTFETVSIDATENVFFTNLDPQAEHWPTLSDNKIGAAPSDNSSQCTIPSGTTPYQVSYTCQIQGHASEKGLINVFGQLAAANTKLQPATKGQPITKQQVVVGGKSPYTISGQAFQITGGNNGAGIGPGLQLTATTDNTGIWVTGTPTVSGTYNFTFTVDDAMGRNLQQVQYSMQVA